ncbi:beta-ribofuranosylaminobenzene 5'-phosphate synthase family protein [Streptomyces sp. NPDC046862]|uniref:beta-ribofuranosylaminobenzene 5'-phosphate synthase family protein n=1 Tax=Streptomyces sp. NPDC046862 TaxID=3154603 RepID=UPI003454385C
MIVCHPRLHLGLLDTAGVSGRVFGGAGFSIAFAPIALKGRRARRCAVTGGTLTVAERRSFTAMLESLSCDPVEVEIEQELPRHVGLGTGTALSLGLVRLAGELSGATPSEADLLVHSRRAGTSGIGFHSFLKGGFIIDGGQPNRGQELRPSGASRPRESPPLIARMELPGTWRVALMLPEAGRRVSGAAEREFFAKNTPTSAEECLRAFPALYHGLAVAVAQADIGLLKSSLLEYQRLGFKRLEISAQSPQVQDLLSALHELPDCASGMSSFGPLIFTVYDGDDRESRRRVEKVAGERAVPVYGHGLCRNYGYQLM